MTGTDIPHPDDEQAYDAAYDEMRAAGTAMSGEADSSKPKALKKRKRGGGDVSEGLAQMVKEAVAEAMKETTGCDTLMVKGRGKGKGTKVLTAANVENLKAAAAAVARSEEAVEHAKQWFEHGVTAFQGQLATIRSARVALNRAIYEITGEGDAPADAEVTGLLEIIPPDPSWPGTTPHQQAGGFCAPQPPGFT